MRFWCVVPFTIARAALLLLELQSEAEGFQPAWQPMGNCYVEIFNRKWIKAG